MNAAQLIELASAVAALGTLVFAAGRFAESVRANTKATDKLSDMIDGHLKWSAQVVREHDERFHEHDRRITVLEESKGRR